MGRVWEVDKNNLRMWVSYNEKTEDYSWFVEVESTYTSPFVCENWGGYKTLDEARTAAFEWTVGYYEDAHKNVSLLGRSLRETILEFLEE